MYPQKVPTEQKFEKLPSEDDTKSLSKPKTSQTTLQFTTILDDTNCLIFRSGIKIMLWDFICFTAKK